MNGCGFITMKFYLQKQVFIIQGSLETQNQYNVCVCVCVCMYVSKKIYFKELTHTIMEAIGKSKICRVNQ